MPIITGGNIIHGGNVLPQDEPNVIMVQAVPTDALVGGGYWTPSDGQIACDVRNQNFYERRGGVWTRIDKSSFYMVKQTRERDTASKVVRA